MTNEAKQQAWRRLCSQLEALGLDPYAPQMPPDESHHPQVQAILAEYKAAIGEIVPVPPSWEGHPPLRAMKTLADLAAWLNEQWNFTLSTEMGGEAYKADVLEQAVRAVRNGFRVLAWLGVEDRAERPLPAETLAVAKQQLDDLERWVRQKVKNGWMPPKPSQPAEASPGTTVKRRKRAVNPDNYEANIRIKQYLDKNPGAPIRKVAKAVELSVGMVNQMDAWRWEMAQRIAAKPPPKVRESQLTKEMLAAIGREDYPAIKKVMKDEAIWQWLLENADKKQRAELHMKTPDKKAELIELAREQYEAEHAAPDD